WIPYVIHQMDRRYQRGNLPKLRQAPSHYLRDGSNIYVTCEAHEDIMAVLKCISEDQLVTGSDYPHSDNSTPSSMIGEFDARTDLAPELRRKILSDNPLRLYHLE